MNTIHETIIDQFQYTDADEIHSILPLIVDVEVMTIDVAPQLVFYIRQQGGSFQVVAEGDQVYVRQLEAHAFRGNLLVDVENGVGGRFNHTIGSRCGALGHAKVVLSRYIQKIYGFDPYRSPHAYRWPKEIMDEVREDEIPDHWVLVEIAYENQSWRMAMGEYMRAQAKGEEPRDLDQQYEDYLDRMHAEAAKKETGPENLNADPHEE